MKGAPLSRRRRTGERNGLSLVTAVNAEVFAVDRDHVVLGKKLTEANLTKVGQVGLAVGVARGQSFQLGQVVVAIKRECDQSLAQRARHFASGRPLRPGRARR